LIVEIRLIALNVTTPIKELQAKLDSAASSPPADVQPNQ
jgi:hypothetical protein